MIYPIAAAEAAATAEVAKIGKKVNFPYFLRR